MKGKKGMGMHMMPGGKKMKDGEMMMGPPAEMPKKAAKKKKGK